METTEGKITGECMRIVVVCTSRSSGAAIANILEKKYNLNNLSEVFADGTGLTGNVRTKLKKLKKIDNYVARVTSTTFLQAKYFTHKNFPWKIFDKIVVVERDIVETCASWFMTSYSQIHGHSEASEMHAFLQEKLKTPKDIPIDEHALSNMLEDIDFFYDTIKPYILSNHPSACLISRELVNKPQEEFLPVLSNILGDEITTEHLEVQRFPKDYSNFIQENGFVDIINSIREKRNVILDTPRDNGV
jgi:hypothetical protein